MKSDVIALLNASKSLNTSYFRARTNEGPMVEVTGASDGLPVSLTAYPVTIAVTSAEMATALGYDDTDFTFGAVYHRYNSIDEAVTAFQE